MCMPVNTLTLYYAAAHAADVARLRAKDDLRKSRPRRKGKSVPAIKPDADLKTSA